MLKRLNGSWYLTDGILSPVRLDAPGCVAEALRGAGLLADGEGAADLLKAEWIYRREWRYSLSPEGGFPADGRAYVSLFGLHGEWTALLDGRELARGDASETEIALPAGTRGATLTLVFAAPSADARWPRIGLDGGCLLRTVGGAAIESLLLNTPDDAPWTACAVVNAASEGACEVRYALEIGGERTETIVQMSLSPGENDFEHAVHEPVHPADFASGVGSTEYASGASGAASTRCAAGASGAVSTGYASGSSGAASTRYAAGVSDAASIEYASGAFGAASSERAAMGAEVFAPAAFEDACTVASEASLAPNARESASAAMPSASRGFFSRILHKNERPADASGASGAASTGYASGASGVASTGYASGASGAASTGYASGAFGVASTGYASDASGAASTGYASGASGAASAGYASGASGAASAGYASGASAGYAAGAGSCVRTASENGCGAVSVSLHMEVWLDGAVSDARDARLCLATDDVAPRGFAGADAVAAARAADVGANALCAPDVSRARMAAAEHGLTFIPYHSLATQRAARACQRYEALLQLAGDESRMLDPALWRLTGCDPDAPDLAALLSPDGDFEAACRLSRYRQAISLRDAAEHARMKRVPFLLDGARDEAPVCASGALFDLDGAARPAYFALADAWRPEHAFVLPPESFPADGIVSVPVFYLSDEKMPPCTVNVRAYSMDGQERITAGFPVPGRATDIVGRLCVEMPEDGLLLLRASVLRDGTCVSRSDRLIALNDDCLSSLRPVQLLRDGDNLRNASAYTAIGVSVPAAQYFGALLPGETLALNEARLSLVEALNPLM